MKENELMEVLSVLNAAKEKADNDGAKFFEQGYYSKLENAIETIERKLLFNHLREDI